MNLFEQKSAELAAKQKSIADLFAAYPDLNMPEPVLHDIQTANAELKDLGAEVTRLRELTEMNASIKSSLADYNRPAGSNPGHADGQPAGNPMAQKSIGQLFTETAGFKTFRPGRDNNMGVEIPGVALKTTMSDAAGFAPPNFRGPVVIYSAQRTPRVADLIPRDPTDQRNAVKYMQETTFTNTAANRAEGASATDATLAFTEVTQSIQIISVSLPVTNEQLEDVPAVQGIIDNRLRLMMQLQEESQLLTGTGSSPQLQGLLNVSGIQTQAVGADTVPDALFKAITLVRFTGFTEPTALVIHPTNWQYVRLLRTQQGIYIFGDPSMPGVDTIWGLPVVQTPAITLNTGLVGNFQQYAHVSQRLGVTVAITNSHASEFTSGIMHMRLDMRESLECYRNTAFCSITSLS